jgi:uncharacterized membrane protein
MTMMNGFSYSNSYQYSVANCSSGVLSFSSGDLAGSLAGSLAGASNGLSAGGLAAGFFGAVVPLWTTMGVPTEAQLNSHLA